MGLHVFCCVCVGSLLINLVCVQPIKTVWVWPVELGDDPLQAPRFLYYSHGGCYCLGSPGTHLLLLCQLAKDTGAAVFAGALGHSQPTDCVARVLSAHRYASPSGYKVD